MISKIVLVVIALFYLGNNVSCETIDEVIADLSPKVNVLQSHISLVIGHGRQQIGLTRLAIREEVQQQAIVLDKHFLEVSETAKQWKTEAEAAGKNVDQCIDQANKEWGTVDFHPLEKCKSSPALDVLGVKLGELGDLKNGLGTSISSCQSKNTEAAALRKCIEGDLANVQGHVDEIEENIQSTCENSKEVAHACAVQVGDQVNSVIDSTLKHLKDCIQNA